ncbi:MAG: peptidase, partial [Ignavibacteriaceae bacterium]|nr:peptidase [Ignavibacteriaceae bacterium]
MKSLFFMTFLTILTLTGCIDQKSDDQTNYTEDIKVLREKINKFVPVDIKYDASLLNERENVVLEKLYNASKIIDEIFLSQVYSKNFEIRNSLIKMNNERAYLQVQLFNIMFGPFDRLDHDKPFIGEEEKPLGANFYPEDMTKEEFETWIKNNPEDEKAFTSEFTVISIDGDKIIAIPYSEYYKDKLTEVSKLLKEAAEYADNPSLKKYLISRANAFLSNDYYQSDMDWMDLKDHTIEIVIGPYEVYEDGLFNYKA